MKNMISIFLTVVICYCGLLPLTSVNAFVEPKQEEIAVVSGGKVLQKNVDYYLTYYNNVNVGTATIEIHFMGNYAGILKQEFRINRRKTSDSLTVYLPTPTLKPIENAKKHIAYIVGDDGCFRPEDNITRAEVAAIFARLISTEKDEKINGEISFSDVEADKWYFNYIGYLQKYSIINGYSDGSFRPNMPITRAEYVAMTVRFYDLLHDQTYASISVDTEKYKDIKDNHWAMQDIACATDKKWINGYEDGSFRADANITRAEAVTITNRAAGRNPDKTYINKHISLLHTFADLRGTSHWAFYDIAEAANEHECFIHSDNESWTNNVI